MTSSAELPGGFEHLAAQRRPFTIESDWDGGFFVLVDGGKRAAEYRSFVEAANVVIAPRSIAPVRNVFDAAYARELNTYLDFDGDELFTVGVGVGLGVRLDGESASFTSLAEALRWLDGAVARVAASVSTSSDYRGPKTRGVCPTCGKFVDVLGTIEDFKDAELECVGSDEQPHSPALLVVATIQ